MIFGGFRFGGRGVPGGCCRAMVIDRVVGTGCMHSGPQWTASEKNERRIEGVNQTVLFSTLDGCTLSVPIVAPAFCERLRTLALWACRRKGWPKQHGQVMRLVSPSFVRAKTLDSTGFRTPITATSAASSKKFSVPTESEGVRHFFHLFRSDALYILWDEMGWIETTLSKGVAKP